MEEETTTNAPVSDGGSINGVPVNDQGQAVEPQPEQTETAEAVTEPTNATTSEPQSDNSDDVQDFLKKKGIDTSNPEEALRKVADMARNAEKAMHDKAKKASELEKTLSTSSDEYAEDVALQTGQDPELLKRLQRVEVRDSVRDFWDNNPDAREFEQDMIKELQQRPHLAGDLDALWAVVQSKNSDVIKSQGKKEALESLAHKQQAAVPKGNAVTPTNTGQTKITPENVDQLVAQNDLNWFRENRDAINRAMAG